MNVVVPYPYLLARKRKANYDDTQFYSSPLEYELSTKSLEEQRDMLLKIKYCGFGEIYDEMDFPGVIDAHLRRIECEMRDEETKRKIEDDSMSPLMII